MKRPAPYTILVPAEVVTQRLTGTLYGYRHDRTRVVNVVACSDDWRAEPSTFALPAVLGRIAPGADESAASQPGLHGCQRGEALNLFLDGEPCQVATYSLTTDVFSRQTGILETGVMLDCAAILVGCGSVGSLLALELARSGVGHFLLIDTDVLAYHNLCRHQCGRSDVGRFKAEALADRIRQINPAAEVEAHTEVIQRLPAEVFEHWCGDRALIAGCADNREADLYANRISCLWGIPFLSVGLWERAAAGELYWNVPGEGACYHCLFGGQAQVLSQRQSVNRRIYTTEEDLATVHFEPGISADIDFVTLLGVKVAIDLLNRRTPGFRPRVVPSLRQFTLVCNSNDPTLGGDLVEIFDHPLQITRSLTVDRQADCPHCRLVPAAGHAPADATC